MLKPFAVELYEWHRQGASIEELSQHTGIARERIEQRLRAAEEYLKEPSRALGWLENATRS